MNKIKNLLKGILLGVILCMSLTGCASKENGSFRIFKETDANKAYTEMCKEGVVNSQGLSYQDICEQLSEEDEEIFNKLTLDMYNDVYLESFEDGEFNETLYVMNMLSYTSEYDDFKEFCYDKYEKEDSSTLFDEPKYTKADLYQEFTYEGFGITSDITMMIGGFKTYEGKYIPMDVGSYYSYCDCLGNCYTMYTECTTMFTDDEPYNEHYGAHESSDGHNNTSLSSICESIETAVSFQADSYNINIECIDCGYTTSISQPENNPDEGIYYDFYSIHHTCENCNSENIFGRINGLEIKYNSWDSVKTFTGDYDVIINFNNSTKIYELLDEEVLEKNIDTTLL